MKVTCSKCGSDQIRQIDIVTTVAYPSAFERDPETHEIRATDYADNKPDWNSQRVEDEEYPFYCAGCNAALFDFALADYKPGDPNRGEEIAAAHERGEGWLVIEADAVPAAPTPADVSVIRNALGGADDFIAGFDGDDAQEPGSIEGMQTDIQNAFGELSKLVDERDAWTAQRAALLHGIESAAQTIAASAEREKRLAKAVAVAVTFCMSIAPDYEPARIAVADIAEAQAGGNVL